MVCLATGHSPLRHTAVAGSDEDRASTPHAMFANSAQLRPLTALGEACDGLVVPDWFTRQPPSDPALAGIRSIRMDCSVAGGVGLRVEDFTPIAGALDGWVGGANLDLVDVLDAGGRAQPGQPSYRSKVLTLIGEKRSGRLNDYADYRRALRRMLFP